MIKGNSQYYDDLQESQNTAGDVCHKELHDTVTYRRQLTTSDEVNSLKHTVHDISSVAESPGPKNERNSAILSNKISNTGSLSHLTRC